MSGAAVPQFERDELYMHAGAGSQKAVHSNLCARQTRQPCGDSVPPPRESVPRLEPGLQASTTADRRRGKRKWGGRGGAMLYILLALSN